MTNEEKADICRRLLGVEVMLSNLGMSTEQQREKIIEHVKEVLKDCRKKIAQ